MTADFYKDLGVDRNATEEEIKAAHRKRAKETHPDNGGNADEFSKVQHAYLVLKDPVKREHYDKEGTEKKEPEDKSLVMINDLFAMMLQRDDLPPDFNYVDAIKDALDGMVEEGAKVIKDSERKIKKFEKLKKRFKNKKAKEGKNLFTYALDYKIKTAKDTIQKNTNTKENAIKARALMEHYEYTPDVEADTREQFRATFTFFGNRTT